MPNKDKQNWLQKLIMTGAMAENAPVMTAAGYRHTKDGTVVQDKQDDPEVQKLRGNIAKIGAAGAASSAPEMLWKAYSNPVVSNVTDVATGNYGDAAIGLATDLIPGQKVVDVVKKVLPTDFINVSKFDNIFPFSRAKRSTIAPGESFDYRTGTSRNQRELDVARDEYRNALRSVDRQLIGKAADNYNRATNKFYTQTGVATRTDEDIVEEFNALRALAAHNRSLGGDYLNPTRKGLKLVPELNKRVITSNYYPTIDDFTYTQATDYDRLRHEAKKYGSKAMEAAANNDLREYNRNIKLAHSLYQKADQNFGGIHRHQGIGKRTYTGINLPKTLNLRPLSSNIPIRETIVDRRDIEELFSNLDFDINQSGDVFNLNSGNIRFNVIPTKHGLKIDYLNADPDIRKSDGLIEKFREIGNSARDRNIPVYFSNRYTTTYNNGIKYQSGLQFLGKLMDRGITGAGKLENELYDLGTHFYLRKNGGKLK